MNLYKFSKLTVNIILASIVIFTFLLILNPSIYDSLFVKTNYNIELHELNNKQHESVFNSECNYNLEEAKIIVENSVYKNNYRVQFLGIDSVGFTYTKWKCFNKISNARPDKSTGELVLFLQPLPKRTLAIILYVSLIIYALTNNLLSKPISKTKKYIFAASLVEKITIALATLLFLISIFMFFFNKIPQFESNITILNSKYITLSKPTQIYNESLTVPIFDGSCKYSPDTAIQALTKNGVLKNNINISTYPEKGFFNPATISFFDYKCWDRVVGSTYSQGTILGPNQEIELFHNPYPRSRILLLSFLFLVFSLRVHDLIYNSESKIKVPIYFPSFVVNNFHILLFALTIFQFSTFMRNINGFSEPFTNTYIFSIFFGIFIVVYLIKKSSNNLYLLGISGILILTTYSIVLFDNLSFNQLFTDVDVYQSQLPISILQFEQVKSYGQLFSWNPNLGAGYILEGQYATNSIIRKFIFLVSPNFIFATNFYVFIHLIIGLYVLILFFKEVGFSSYTSVIGSYVFFTSNQVITWTPFIHYPSFILAFALLNYSMVISNKNKFRSFALFALGFYIVSSGGHLQNVVFLYLYCVTFLLFGWFTKTIKGKLNYQTLSISLISSSLISLYYVLPFFEVLNNLGDRTGMDSTKYFDLDDLVGFVNNRILRESGELIYNYSINKQLFISSIFLFVFLSIRSDKKSLEKFTILLFSFIFFFSSNNPLQNAVVDLIPGFALISNWQRTAPFLILLTIIYILSKLETYVKIQSRNTVYLIIVLSVLISGISRVNVFYNVNITGLRSAYLYEHTKDLEAIGNRLNLETTNSRILSVCNLNEHLHITADANLIVDNKLYWAGLYESFPNSYYTNKFKLISSTPPGLTGGRYYTHINGDFLDTTNLNVLNIEYLIVKINECKFDMTNLTKVDQFGDYRIFKNLDVEPIIHIGRNKSDYLIPDSINRLNPESIEIFIDNNRANYLYVNEIYSNSWSAKNNGESVEILNNNGFMKIKLQQGKNDILLIFNNKNIVKNFEELVRFLRS